MFSETPLPFEKMKDTDAKLHLACGELVLGERSIKDLDSNVRVEHGKITFDLRAAGAHEGTLQGAGTLVPAGDGTADLELKIDVADLRANLGSEGHRACGCAAGRPGDEHQDPRQLAAADGIGRQRTPAADAGRGQNQERLHQCLRWRCPVATRQKLNPFAKDDPFMKLDCTIARADIVNGEVTVKPVVIQTEKVTITAHGNIDLRTEKLLLDFNTRPRKGIGVSPGHVHQPAHPAGRNIGEPEDWRGCEGRGVGRAGGRHRRRDRGRGRPVRSHGQGEQDICKKTLTAATNPVATS